MASRETTRPNIVFVLSDDHGPWGLGCYGNREIRTPNLDRLAAEGTRFEYFFCTSPVCSPARASLLTGRIPSQHGVHDWIREGNVGDDAVEYLAGQTAYTEVLAGNGYTCDMSGKWHLGDSVHPQKGFSHWYVHQCGGGRYYDAPMIRDGVCIDEPGYVTDNITDDALACLDDRAGDDSPFYLSVHYTAPHAPWIDSHPERIVASYDDCPFESCPQEPKHPWAAVHGAWPNPRESLKGYFAAVTAMDDNIGRILKKLADLGLRENTLVCYLSDNGFNCGHHGVWGKGNGTFPQNMYENSVRVPAIMSQPGRIPQGAACDALVSGYDFMPTLLDYVGLGNPEADRLPGKSFLPILLGQDADEREDVVVFDEYGPVRMIRTRQMKYVHRYPYGPHELYDLANDPDERANMVDDPERQRVVEEMRARLEAWFVRYVDPGVDGLREAVTGRGQLYLAGPGGSARRSFAPKLDGDPEYVLAKGEDT